MIVCQPCIQAAENEYWPTKTDGEPADLCMALGAQMNAHDCITVEAGEACACSYPHTAKVFYQTMIFVQVLSEEPVPDAISLADVAREIGSGDYSGKEVRITAAVDGPTMVKLLEEQGSDPSFFGLSKETPDDYNMNTSDGNEAVTRLVSCALEAIEQGRRNTEVNVLLQRSIEMIHGHHPEVCSVTVRDSIFNALAPAYQKQYKVGLYAALHEPVCSSCDWPPIQHYGRGECP